MEENFEAKMKALDDEVKGLKRKLIIIGYFLFVLGMLEIGFAFILLANVENLPYGVSPLISDLEALGLLFVGILQLILGLILLQ